MISLKTVTIHKFKSIESEQKFELEKDVTVFVGKNESGKTSVLEALAKAKYFDNDEKLSSYNDTYDYPKRTFKKMRKSGERAKALVLTYELSDSLVSQINTDLGEGVFDSKTVSVTAYYDNKIGVHEINIALDKFWSVKLEGSNISEDTQKQLREIKSGAELSQLIETLEEEDVDLSIFEKYFKHESWENPIWEYIWVNYVSSNRPKFIYYDEYYMLPSRINLQDLRSGKLKENSQKTANALVELGDIDVEELITTGNFEEFKAELEAVSAEISMELFEYWKSNINLEILFDIDKVLDTTNPQNHTISAHILDIRVKNRKKGVSLPLGQRSKGFNWFFSFLVWFKKIQEDKDSNYIILMDEPGLNLHASAQNDLLRFIDDLSKDYQIIYTTHSPFMVNAESLHRVRTVYDTEDGTKISDAIQEKDPDTLFPLQAALGYDICQNLFISKKNILVEGVSDLIYLEVMSGILEKKGLPHLSPKITLVPVGGLDKVSSFVSLLRGSKMKIACLLDSDIDRSNKAKMDNLVRAKIIKANKIRFYHEFVDGLEAADIEDLFEKEEYLKLYNMAFSAEVSLSDLNLDIGRIVIQLNKYLSVDRFNHYRPANELAKMGIEDNDLSADTLARFSVLFEKMNKLF